MIANGLTVDRDERIFKYLFRTLIIQSLNMLRLFLQTEY